MKKRITPLSVICDENKLPVAMIVIPINKTLSNGVKTAKHDVSCIQETLDNINFQVPEYVKISVTGDKGYITSKKFTIQQRVVTITAPKRRNQKIKTSNKEKKLLRERYKIENVFAIIKTSPRVFVRSEANLHPRTFETARLPFRIFEVLTYEHLEQNVKRYVLNVHRFKKLHVIYK